MLITTQTVSVLGKVILGGTIHYANLRASTSVYQKKTLSQKAIEPHRQEKKLTLACLASLPVNLYPYALNSLTVSY